jgi:nitronate monooxygenase
MLSTAVTRLLEIDVPLIQAPMGGGPSTPEMAGTVSDAGALGSLAGGYLSGSQISQQIAAVRAVTNKPFAVNLFAPHDSAPTPEEIDEAQRLLEPYRRELGLPARGEAGPAAPDFDEQLHAVIDEKPNVVSFTFGLLPPAAVASLKDAGCVLIGTATTVAEAVAVAESGADMVCAQGSEAGAHRGTFLSDGTDALVGTIALVPQVRDSVSIPVVAAGGIMDGRGVVAVLALGAGAAQLGTAFLRCPEAGTAPAHRQALSTATDTSTAVSASITGKPARGINNRLMRELAGHAMPAYPHTNALTSELRRRAAELGEAELMSLWAGQGAPLGTELPARELVAKIAEDAATALTRLGGAHGS